MQHYLLASKQGKTEKQTCLMLWMILKGSAVLTLDYIMEKVFNAPVPEIVAILRVKWF